MGLLICSIPHQLCNGNRLTQTTTQNGAVTQTLTYTYGTANQLVQIVDQTGTVQSSYVYDAAGNRIQKSSPSGNTLYNYDERNLITTVISPSSTTTYNYNGLGQRVSETVDGTTTNYIIDSIQSPFQAVQERAGGTIVQSYAYGVDLLEVYPQSSQSMFPVSGGSLFYLPDRLGSIRLITNGSGAIQQMMNYDAFGNNQP